MWYLYLRSNRILICSSLVVGSIFHYNFFKIWPSSGCWLNSLESKKRKLVTFDFKNPFAIRYTHTQFLCVWVFDDIYCLSVYIMVYYNVSYFIYIVFLSSLFVTGLQGYYFIPLSLYQFIYIWSDCVWEKLSNFIHFHY